MTTTYLLRRSYSPAGSPVVGGVTIAWYRTLAGAVAGARRAYARRPDSSLTIVSDGRELRCLYHHGLPPDPRWDAA